MKARQELPLRLRGRQVVVTVEKEGLEFKLHGKREGFFLDWQKAAALAFGTPVFTEREIANHEARKTVRETREAVFA